ncbi:MAG: photosynthetic reaction center cytochrome c subunit [Acidobacteria bacterium]|nr:photosynthetic reaction center cytochrome c subunit [Acidobacteriota bacterium]
MNGSTRRFIAAAIVLAGCFTVGLSGRQAPAPPPMADQVFKNIQVLKGIPVDEFMLTMGFYATATGLNCTDCHVEESGGSWARYADDNPLKMQTRRMQVMMTTINRTNFGGRQVVTCDTCHRGFSRPNVMPSINRLYGSPAADEPGDPIEQAAGQPSPDQILDQYMAALGTPKSLAALTSFTGKGTYMGFDDAGKSPVELFARATGERSTVVHTPLGDSTTTITPAGGWVTAPPTDKPVPLMQITGQELDGVRVEAMVFFPATLRKSLTKLRSGLPQLLEDDSEVLQVQGNTANGATVTLLIDSKTHLLRRLVRYNESPVGRLVARVDYHEYRDVAGVKLPSRWTVSWVSGRSHFEMTSAEPNVAIPATRFVRPNLPQTLVP